MVVFVLLLSLAVLLLGRIVDDSIMSPNRIIPFMWVFLIIVPLLFWDADYTWKGAGLICLLLAMICMELGGLFSKGTLFFRDSTYIGDLSDDFESEYRYFTGNYKVIAVIIALSLVGVAGKVYLAGYGLSDFMSFKSFVQMSRQVAVDRYSGQTETSTATQILSTFSYLAALMGGYAYNYAKEKRERILCFLSFLPMTIEMLYANTKSGFIGNIFLWFAGWCASRISINKELPKIKGKTVALTIFGAAAFTCIMVFVMALRAGDFSRNMLENRLEEFFLYGFGGTIGFDYWFANGTDLTNYDSGINTFMAFSKHLGFDVLEV